MARRLPTKARLEIDAYEVVQRAIEEGSAHAVRRILEDRPDEPGMRGIIEHEVSLALDGVVRWPD